jgi:trehalose 6-phosphate synthase
MALNRQTGATGVKSRQAHKLFDFIVVSNRLPVAPSPTGGMRWYSSPGGLVSALRPVVEKAAGAWVGWTGQAVSSGASFAPGRVGEGAEGWRPQSLGQEARLWEARLWDAATPGLEAAGEPQPVADEATCEGGALGGEEVVNAIEVPLSEEEVRAYYEGFCNATIWPLYHDVAAPPVYSRRWWHAYVEVNHRFAAAVAGHAAPSGTVWVHDYHLQLVPALLREARPDLRIGFFNHIPFPGVDLFAQLPWRKEVIDGLLGADLVGFQTPGGAANFLRACRRFAGVRSQGPFVSVEGPSGRRTARVGAFAISVDARELSELAKSPAVRRRARQIREELGWPEVVLLGVDRLDYTKGLLHRLRAYGELLSEGRLGPPAAVLLQVASPSRDEVAQYKKLREEVERVVGAVNGDFSPVGRPAVHYLHQSFPKQEMAAMYLAADVVLVTPLRDGMNLVAKEYVACRPDQGGRLVLSELAGAANELREAWLVNPYDIDTMKRQIMAAVEAGSEEAASRMRRMRRWVFAHDVHRWAAEFLGALAGEAGG